MRRAQTRRVLFFDYMLSDAQKILADRDYVVTNTKVPSPIDRSTMHVMDLPRCCKRGRSGRSSIPRWSRRGDSDLVPIFISGWYDRAAIWSDSMQKLSIPKSVVDSYHCEAWARARVRQTRSSEDRAGRGRHAERLHAAGRGARAVPEARIVPNINRLADAVRDTGGAVVWIKPPSPTRRRAGRRITTSGRAERQAY